MSETTDTTTTTDAATTQDESQVDDSTQPNPAEEIKRLRAEAAKYRVTAKENAAKAKQLDELMESQKSEAQKLADRAVQAERERDEARLEALRIKVGAAKKLPAEVIDRLRGETEEELAADADRLAEHFKASVRPAGSVDQGQRGTAPAQNPRDAFAGLINKAIGQS